MFVRKSTHDAALARAARAEAAAFRLKRSQSHTLVECSKLIAENKALKDELATTYVRNALGRMQKHPSAAPVKLESVA